VVFSKIIYIKNKTMKKYISIMIVFVCAIGLIWSCTKKVDLVDPVSGIDGFAFIRVMHVSPNFRAIQNYPDSFHIYVGANKINGGLFTYNSAFPSTALNNNTYAAVPSGPQQIRLSLIGVTKVDSLTIISLQKNLEAGKYYTFFITDSLQSQQDATKVWVNDINFLPTDTSQYKVRFAHMILNDTAGKKVDVYSYRQAANIFSGISPGTVTDYLAIPTAFFAVDTISIRRTGTGFELARINGITYGKTRLYTILFKGNPGSTSGTKGRSAIIYNNR
jgi:hypothetical protein